MRGQVPPAASMPQWVERLMTLRRTVGHEPPEPIVDAIGEARACGTTLVGDVTNTLAAYGPLADSDLSAAIFRELLGFTVQEPDAVMTAARIQLEELTPMGRLRTSIVPHAPYSVSPALLRAIASADDGSPISLHLGESAEEIEFLRSGGGPWRKLLASLGAWQDGWRPPGVGPIHYVAAHGLLSERLLAVHCVQLGDDELALLADAGATVVTCPRSNRWVGAGRPPIECFYASDVRVAVGTDSLASAPDLSVFAELATMRALAPSVPASRLLESATIAGARALGFDADYGTIEPGKVARLIAVEMPADTRDVEEYLVSGVHPQQLRWIE